MWCALLIGFFGFLRKSNLVPPSLAAFEPGTHLSRATILRTPYGLMITLKKTKTVQCGERLIQIPIAAIPGSPLDPALAFDYMCFLNPVPASAPAFSYLSPLGLSSITHRSLVDKLRRLLALAGFDASQFAGHSLRRGGCSCAFAAQVPSELIKMHGDWHSQAYLCYLTIPLEQRLQVTLRMGQQLSI